jgi:hypothetical protein
MTVDEATRWPRAEELTDPTRGSLRERATPAGRDDTTIRVSGKVSGLSGET